MNDARIKQYHCNTSDMRRVENRLLSYAGILDVARAVDGRLRDG